MLVAINALFALFVWMLFVRPDILINITTTPLMKVVSTVSLGEALLLMLIFIAVMFAMKAVDKVMEKRKALSKSH